MKADTDSVRYCRIRMWNRIEKINENWIGMYPLFTTTLNLNTDTDIYIDV